MSDLDVVYLPGQPGMWSRGVVAEAWQEAGSPAPDWAGRTYEEQKYLSDGWKARKPGFNAADDPDLSWTRVPHVRGMALDLRVWNAATVRRMEQAGFTRPIWKSRGFSQDEPWHFELARFVGNIRTIPKVTAAQVAAADSEPFTTTDIEEDDMGYAFMCDINKPYYWFSFARGKSRQLSGAEVVQMRSAERSGIPGNEIHKVGEGWYNNQLKLGLYT